jgi:hypothetical protein
MIEIYEKEIEELIMQLSKVINVPADIERFSRLCWLIGNLQGQLLYFEREKKQ